MSGQTLHEGIECDNCRGDVHGKRYKCLSCPDYDLCTSCKADGVHSQHRLFLISEPAARNDISAKFKPVKPDEFHAELPLHPKLHHFVQCNQCKGLVIGVRYKCPLCKDYDLCSGCNSIADHPHYPLKRLPEPLPVQFPTAAATGSHFTVTPSDGLELLRLSMGEKGMKGTLALHNKSKQLLGYQMKGDIRAPESISISSGDARAAVGPGGTVDVEFTLLCGQEPDKRERTVTVVSAVLSAPPTSEAQLEATLDGLTKSGSARSLTLPVELSYLDVSPESHIDMEWNPGKGWLRGSIVIRNLSAKRHIGIQFKDTIRKQTGEQLTVDGALFSLGPRKKATTEATLKLPGGSITDYPRQLIVTAFALEGEPYSASALACISNEKCAGPQSYWTRIDLKLPSRVTMQAPLSNVMQNADVGGLFLAAMAEALKEVMAEQGGGSAQSPLMNAQQEYLGFFANSAVGGTWDLRGEPAKPKKRLRAGWPYYRPASYLCLLLADNMITGKYGADMRWLGRKNGDRAPGAWARPADESEQRAGEWALCYHGTDKVSAVDIMNNGFAIEKCERSKFGMGIYTAPDPYIAEGYADAKEPWLFRGKKYKILVISRVQPTAIITENGAHYWLIKQTACLHPYGLAIKEYDD